MPRNRRGQEIAGNGSPERRWNFRSLFWSGRIDLPHDLAKFVVEATLSLEEGSWNLVANGATFKSIGRRRTKPGRQLIAAHRTELDEAERIVNAHLDTRRAGDPTPVGPGVGGHVGWDQVAEWP
jgi:hypothetical protein